MTSHSFSDADKCTSKSTLPKLSPMLMPEILFTVKSLIKNEFAVFPKINGRPIPRTTQFL